MPLSYAALLSGRPRRSLESSRQIMASYTTSEIRGGLKVLLDGDPYTVIENEFVKPGKGQAFNRIKVRNLKTGRTIERTFRSGESLEAADVVDTDMQYLYQDGDFWHFMVPESFEQYTAGKSAVGENAQWLKDGVVCAVTLWNNVPLVGTPPARAGSSRDRAARRTAAAGSGRCTAAPRASSTAVHGPRKRTGTAESR